MEVWAFLAKIITQNPASQYLPGTLAVLVRYNQALSTTINASNSLLQLKKIIQRNFLLTD